MIFAEFVALVALLCGSAVGLSALGAWKHRRAWARLAESKRKSQMNDELVAALMSKDYRKLDAMMVVYCDDLTPAMLEKIKAVREDLYIESNP